MIPRPIAVIRTKARIEDKTMHMILDTLFIYFSLLFDINSLYKLYIGKCKISRFSFSDNELKIVLARFFSFKIT